MRACGAAFTLCFALLIPALDSRAYDVAGALHAMIGRNDVIAFTFSRGGSGVPTFNMGH